MSTDRLNLTLVDLRAANVERQREWNKAGGIDLSYRGNELAGETGEACNVIKKLERERLGIRGSRATLQQLAEELADVVICVDLIAMATGIELGAAVVAKFNATSEKVGLATRLQAGGAAAASEGRYLGASLANGVLQERVEDLRSKLARATAQRDAFRATLERIAYEPIGPSDSTAQDVLDDVEELARMALNDTTLAPRRYMSDSLPAQAAELRYQLREATAALEAARAVTLPDGLAMAVELLDQVALHLVAAKRLVPVRMEDSTRETPAPVDDGSCFRCGASVNTTCEHRDASDARARLVQGKVRP